MNEYLLQQTTIDNLQTTTDTVVVANWPD